MRSLKVLFIAIVLAVFSSTAYGWTNTPGSDGTDGSPGFCSLDVDNKIFYSQQRCALVTLPGHTEAPICGGDSVVITTADLGAISSNATFSTTPPLALSSTGTITETVTNTNTLTSTNTGTGTGTVSGSATVTASGTASGTSLASSAGSGYTWTHTAGGLGTTTTTTTATFTGASGGRTSTQTYTSVYTQATTLTQTVVGTGTITSTTSITGSASVTRTLTGTLTDGGSSTGTLVVPLPQHTYTFCWTKTNSSVTTGTVTETTSFTGTVTNASATTTSTATAATVTASGTTTGTVTSSSTSTSTSTSTNTITGSSVNLAAGKVSDSLSIGLNISGPENYLYKRVGVAIGPSTIMDDGYGPNAPNIGLNDGISTETTKIYPGLEATLYSSWNGGFIYDITAAPNGDIYAVAANKIWIQPGGTGNFVDLNQTARFYNSIKAMSNGNIIAVVYGGGVYERVNGTGDFNSIGEPNRNWYGIGEDIYGNEWATADDIYVRTNHTGSFVAQGTGFNDWNGIDGAADGSVIAERGILYRKPVGSSTFTSISGSPIAAFIDVAGAPNGDVYAAVDTKGVGPYKLSKDRSVWVNLGVTSPVSSSFRGITVLKDGTVLAVSSGRVYKLTASSVDLRLPKDKGNPGQVMSTDGTGQMKWISLNTNTNTGTNTNTYTASSLIKVDVQNGLVVNGTSTLTYTEISGALGNNGVSCSNANSINAVNGQITSCSYVSSAGGGLQPNGVNCTGKTKFYATDGQITSCGDATCNDTGSVCPNAAITPSNTYKAVTYDSKGLVTGGTAVQVPVYPFQVSVNGPMHVYDTAWYDISTTTSNFGNASLVILANVSFNADTNTAACGIRITVGGIVAGVPIWQENTGGASDYVAIANTAVSSVTSGAVEVKLQARAASTGAIGGPSCYLNGPDSGVMTIIPFGH